MGPLRKRVPVGHRRMEGVPPAEMSRLGRLRPQFVMMTMAEIDGVSGRHDAND